MGHLNQVTPFLRVTDIEQAVAFFCDALGFELGFRGGEYAYVRRDAVAFRLIEDEPLPPRGHGRYTSYVDVDDVDALYAELKPKLDLFPAAASRHPVISRTGSASSRSSGPMAT